MANRYFLACDWGTSSFRLHLTESATGRSIMKLEDTDGIRATDLRYRESETTLSRSDFFRRILGEKVEHLLERSGELPHDIDPSALVLVLSGMASSNIGLRELPYADLPFSLESPDLASHRFPPDSILPHPLLLLSGVRGKRDVIRGEEIQLIGLQRYRRFGNRLCLLPGTHSKHMEVSSGRLTEFRTYMTGELFATIARHTILSDSIEACKVSIPEGEKAFGEGVERSGRENLLHSLFTVRGARILDAIDPKLNYLMLSGFLIGAELGDIDRDGPPVLLAGSGELNRLYRMGLEWLDCPFETVEEMDRITRLGQACFLE